MSIVLSVRWPTVHDRRLLESNIQVLRNCRLYFVPHEPIVIQSGFKEHGRRTLASANEMHFVAANVHELSRWRVQASVSGTLDRFIDCPDAGQHQDEDYETAKGVN